MIGLAEVSFIGIVLAVLSIPLALGWVPRNRLYGFRVPTTLRTDRVWYAINRRFGREAIVVGAALALMAASLDAAGFDTKPGRILAGGAMFGSFLVMTVRGWRAANRMERGTQRSVRQRRSGCANG
jgi:SdpI/YhfL family protein